MNEVFPFQIFPYLQQYESAYFTFSRNNETFEEALVKAKLMYRPGAYVVGEFFEEVGNYLYVGESGYKNGRVVEQQLPNRILKATCNLPVAYPDCEGKRALKRATAWKHMMSCDNLSTIIFFVFYSPLTTQNGRLQCRPTPVSLQNQIRQTIIQNGLGDLRWSSQEF